MKQIFKRKGSGIGAQGSADKGISSVRTGFAPVPAGNFIDLAGLKKGISIGLGIVLTLTASAVLAVAVTGTINTFSSGNVVDASQINTNFTSLKTAIEGITSSQWTNTGNSIFFQSGFVGIGMNNPVVNLQITNTNTIGTGLPALRIGGGNADIELLGTNESVISFNRNSSGNYFALSQRTDVGGSNDDFKILRGVSGSFQNIVFQIQNSTGNVGIGTSSPTALLHVAGTAGNTSGTWSSLSDERLKKNIFDYKGSLEKVLNLRPVSFEWKENKEGKTAGRHIGFIAQEVEKIFPEWVSTMSDGNKWMTPEGMNAVLVQSIREMKSLYDHEKSENAKLKQKLLSVEERLNVLEKRK